jgi:hypothetical protein
MELSSELLCLDMIFFKMLTSGGSDRYMEVYCTLYTVHCTLSGIQYCRGKWSLVGGTDILGRYVN